MKRKELVPVGRRVKELRESQGRTQQELASSAGISLSILARIEQTNTKTDPRISTVAALAKALGVGVGALADPAGESSGTATTKRRQPK